MKLVKQKSVLTNGIRHVIKIQKNLLAKKSIYRLKTAKKHSFSNGRCALRGRITAWHRGGGAKKLYKPIEFSNKNSDLIILSVSYDPNRTAFISNCFDLDRKIFVNKIHVNDTFPGALLQTKENLEELKVGSRTLLKNIPLGTTISNISYGSNISKIGRAAGTCAELNHIDNKAITIKLPSTAKAQVSPLAYATIGVASNEKHILTTIGKAGTARHKNRRPIVRGIAMNPVDHPHGGRTNGGRPSVTPWGLPTKGGFYLRKNKRKNK
jgi:large subunit ribosomal protein L2